MIEFAVRRPVSVTMICLGIFVLGFISLKKMPIELLPNIELAEFQVITEYKGASAPEVEKTITIPIERALSIQEGLYHMESESLNNVSKITIRFRNGINIFESLSSVRDKVNEIGFPTGVNKPIVSRSIGKQTPILRIVINSKATNLESLNQFGKSLQETLLPLIEKVEGIALVQLSGIPQKEYQLIFDPVKMSVYQLSLEEVKGIITQSQSSIPAGNFQYQGENITLKLSNENFQLNEILNIVIKQILVNANF